MNKIKIDFSKLNLNKVRDDVNLILFNNGLGDIETMQQTNKLIEVLKNVKFEINII